MTNSEYLGFISKEVDEFQRNYKGNDFKSEYEEELGIHPEYADEDSEESFEASAEAYREYRAKMLREGFPF